MGQSRWVSYIFRYRDGIKCENAGFIKIQRIYKKSNEVARIQIGLRLYKKRSCRCSAYLVDRNNQGIYIGETIVPSEEMDTILKKIELPWKNCLEDGLDIEEYIGVTLLCDDGELLAGMWSDDEPDVSRFQLVNRQEEADKTKQNEVAVDISEKADNTIFDTITEDIDDINIQDNIDVQNNSAEKQEYDDSIIQSAVTSMSEEKEEQSDICREIIDTFPKLPLFPDSPFSDCVKIVPQDIGRLAMGNWKLGGNSFLAHGYYQYRYLMLGTLKLGGKEKYVIGIPGVFTGKEKYLANMFGFNQFVPVKPAKVLTGNFGYWIWEVSRV